MNILISVAHEDFSTETAGRLEQEGCDTKLLRILNACRPSSDMNNSKIEGAFVTSPVCSSLKIQQSILQTSFLTKRPDLARFRRCRLRATSMIPTKMCVSATPLTSKTAPTGPQVESTLVCTSLTAPTVAEQIEQGRTADELGADILEIRIDLLDENEQANWYSILNQVSVPVIVTNRASWEGGNSNLSEKDRLSLLIDAVRRGVNHVDVELKAVTTFKQLCKDQGISIPFENTKLILSHHDFSSSLTDSNVASLVQEMRNAGASVCKIAMTANSALDNLVAIRALQAHNGGGPCIILAMSEYGTASRLLAGKYGGYLTFASLSKNTGSAPGQVDLSTLYNTYKFRNITPSTPMYAVLGDPVAQSMSPVLFNSVFEKLSLRAAYVPMRVESGSYGPFVMEMVKRGFRGFSVTIPGKLDVMEGMDEVDTVAKRIGAMNTVVYDEEHERLKGYNTDWSAAIGAIVDAVAERGDSTGMQGKVVVSIGAGGAGRGLAFGALEKGAKHVIIVNRSIGKAQDLAAELGNDRASAMSLQAFNEGGAGQSVDIIMNSSSVGMTPNEGVSPIVADQMPSHAVVFDAIYNPMETELLRLAKLRGCATVSGLEMFVRQAAQQFEHWFPGMQAPVESMRQVVSNKLLEKQKQ